MKTLIIANWKMNPSAEKEAKKLFGAVKKGIKGSRAEVVICPPFIYLPLFKGLVLGAQNVFYKESGAFTGEVSPLMLKDLKVKYVIIGHSEARQYLNETNEVINKKIKECLLVKLRPILCVGENLGENKFEILSKQIEGGLKNIPEKELKNTIISYEPVWAIGTGRNCSVEETADSILFVKKIISKLYNEEIAKNTVIIYGGSVDGSNAASYIKDGGVSGLLVGGDSLNAEEFIKIVKSV